MGFALEKLGQWTEGPEFKVEADRTKAYAEATNDPIPAHLERSGGTAGVRGRARSGTRWPARWPASSRPRC